MSTLCSVWVTWHCHCLEIHALLQCNSVLLTRLSLLRDGNTVNVSYLLVDLRLLRDGNTVNVSYLLVEQMSIQV